MKKKMISSLSLLTLCAVMGSVSLGATPTPADTSYTPAPTSSYDGAIEQAREDKKASDERIRELKDDLEDIEKDKKDTLSNIKKLDEKSAKLEDSIDKLNDDINNAKDDLKKSQDDLDKANKILSIQYQAMKSRIRYMYENGNDEYLELIFEAGSIAELLTRAEYIEKISEYDRGIFIRYKKAKDATDEAHTNTSKKLTILKGLKEEKTAQKAALLELKEKKKDELSEYEKEEETTKNEKERYEKQAKDEQKKIDKLLRKKQEQIAASDDLPPQGDIGDTDDKYRWPLQIPGRISSGFGYRHAPTAGASTYHKGLDIAVPYGTPIVASASGKVVVATYSSGAGNYVMISHTKKISTVYMHCKKLAVKEKDTVSKGDIVGYVGSTGISTGPHLHFGVMKNGTYVNPLNYVKMPTDDNK